MPVQPVSSSDPGRSREPVLPESRGIQDDTRRRALGTRTSAAWIGIGVGVLVLIMLVVFILQNTRSVAVSFLGMTGTAPLAVVLLVAALGSALIVLLVGGLRIGQLRRRLRTSEQRSAL
jgi:uncharacterized integral membrane protein